MYLLRQSRSNKNAMFRYVLKKFKNRLEIGESSTISVIYLPQFISYALFMTKVEGSFDNFQKSPENWKIIATNY